MKISRNFLIIFLMALSALYQNAFSQSSYSLTFRPTFSISVPNSNPATNLKLSEEPGFGFGVFLSFKFSEHFKLSTGLEFKRKVMGFSSGYYDEEAQTTLTTTGRDAIDQIGVPLSLSYFFSYVNGGPYINLSFSIDHFLSGSTTYSPEESTIFHNTIQAKNISFNLKLDTILRSERLQDLKFRSRTHILYTIRMIQSQSPEGSII